MPTGAVEEFLLKLMGKLLVVEDRAALPDNGDGRTLGVLYRHRGAVGIDGLSVVPAEIRVLVVGFGGQAVADTVTVFQGNQVSAVGLVRGRRGKIDATFQPAALPTDVEATHVDPHGRLEAARPKLIDLG